MARFYVHELERIRAIFRRPVRLRHLLAAFRKHRDAGKLEIITCGATHGFLPLMDPVPQAVRAQVQVAAQHYRKHFGRDPAASGCRSAATCRATRPSCARPASASSSSSRTASPTRTRGPAYGVYAPILSPGGIVVLRPATWSRRSRSGARESGYPGDYDYREFYRDVGLELPLDYLGDLLPDGLRKNVGIKYFRITGKVGLGDKQPYVRAGPWRRPPATPATSFNREKQVEHLAGTLGRPPLVVSPYDAELFGHWWFEGPDFLNFLFRKMHFDQDVVKPITPPEYLERFPDLQVAQPPMSTWGDKGYAEVWLNEGNDWIYRHLDKAAERMVELARRFQHPNDLERRALNQAARELLLAQSSDWAFIMKTEHHGRVRQQAHPRPHRPIRLSLSDARERRVPGGADPQGVRGARQHLSRYRLPRVHVGGPRSHPFLRESWTTRFGMSPSTEI